MRQIRPESIPKRNESIRWKEFGTEGILFDPGTGHYSQLNEVALLIWKQADGRKSLEEVVAGLAAQFDADEDELANDAAEFMEDMIGKGLISVGL
jgi:hypothetical protein